MGWTLNDSLPWLASTFSAAKSPTAQHADAWGGYLAWNVTVVPLTGRSATVSRGSFTPGASIALVGSAASLAGGSLGVALSAQLAGQQVIPALGALTAGLSIQASGLQVAASGGSLYPGLAVQLIGLGASASAGALAADVAVALAGLESITYAGLIAAVGGDSVVQPAASKQSGGAPDGKRKRYIRVFDEEVTPKQLAVVAKRIAGRAPKLEPKLESIAVRLGGLGNTAEPRYPAFPMYEPIVRVAGDDGVALEILRRVAVEMQDEEDLIILLL